MKNTKKAKNVDAVNNGIIGKFADMDKKRKMQFGGANPTQPTAAVINDYSKKKAYGQPGGPSYMPTTPAPAFKKGGAKKK
jgi:hypothetical protein